MVHLSSKDGSCYWPRQGCGLSDFHEEARKIWYVGKDEHEFGKPGVERSDGNLLIEKVVKECFGKLTGRRESDTTGLRPERLS